MTSQPTSILYAELPGFTGLAEHLSSDFNELLKECYEIANTTISIHQGALSNYSGNTFLAVFSNGKTNPEILSIETVNELKGNLEAYFSEKKLPVPVGFKAGIASGDAVVQEFGVDKKKQITVMGKALNIASRLREFAEEGQVLVNEGIFEVAKKKYSFQKLEALPIRGSKDSLKVFELGKKKKIRLQTASFSERKIASEMVGRSRELEQLDSLFKQLTAGKGFIINIVGKAGLGKSRLMDEMKVQPIMEKVLLLEGRALSTGQNLSFHPLTNLIRSWAGITDDDIPSASSEKLLLGIKNIAPEQSDEIYPFMATMMGLPMEGKYKERVKGIEGEALEKLILKNLRDLIINGSKDKPRIYMIEDMHWADSSSITMFESLYKLSQNHPVIFINVMRPGYKETGDYILKYLVDNFPGDHSTININPLEEKESNSLIKNLLRETSLPVGIQKIIIRKTEGNPFFIEEIIRSFIDEGIIEVKEGHFVITEKIKDVDIPETINEAILSRVDKLDEKTRELLNTASVMG
ncbi:MAG: AAA family ATPase, partial [Bacteroidales bacterium]|nr:AAA family ATPase [Bacteroidales bacterium]